MSLRLPAVLFLALALSLTSKGVADQSETLRVDKVELIPSVDYGYVDKWDHVLSPLSIERHPVKTAFYGQNVNVYAIVTSVELVAEDSNALCVEFSAQDHARNQVWNSLGEKHATTVENGFRHTLYVAKTPFLQQTRSGKGKCVLTVQVSGGGTQEDVQDRATLKLVPYKPKQFRGTDSALWMWQQAYHEHPEPELLQSAALRTCATDMMLSAPVEVVSMLAPMLNQNKFVLPELVKRAREENTEVRERVLLLVSYVRGCLEYLDDVITSEELQTIRDFQSTLFTIDPKRLNSPTDLDIMWARFMSTADYDAIRRIVEVFAYEDISVDMLSGKYAGKTLTPEMMRGLMASAARWSIGSNAVQYPLVRKYLNFMLECEDLPDEVRTELGTLLFRLDLSNH